MPSKTIRKTVCQYNKEPIPDVDMQKLIDIAKDYQAVKKQVYQRYGGISALPKLYPGYTIQKELASSTLRDEFGIPAVYFNLAIFDALGDIRSRWAKTKSDVRARVNQNINFTEEEKHYLRFVLKTDGAFSGILNQAPPQNWKMTGAIRRHYEELSEALNTEALGAQATSTKAAGMEAYGKLHRYLCRQVRKLHKKPAVRTVEGFYSSKGTHRYANRGIYFTTKEPRKRVFIPLTDNNTYQSQIYVNLYPAENRIKLRATIQVAARVHSDYINHVGILFGTCPMLLTNEGHAYGAEFDVYRARIFDLIKQHTAKPRTAAESSKKYTMKIHRLQEHLTSYVNKELNRFLQEEKPAVVYLPKLPKNRGKNRPQKYFAASVPNKICTYDVSYVWERLLQKCQEHSVNVVKVKYLNYGHKNKHLDECGQWAAHILPKGLGANS